MSGNRWLDDDDINPSSGGVNKWGGNDGYEDFDPNKDYFTQVVKRKENNILESTQRSLRMLDESERVGVATGQELVRQGEVLRRTEKTVDKMEQDLKESDRHLRSIKSVWGAFMNKFSKEPPAPKSMNAGTEFDAGTSNNLENVMRKCEDVEDERRQNEEHPVIARQQRAQQMYMDGGRDESSSQNKMNQVEENLDLMGQSLSRLKQLGLGMQNEIEAQDPIIERLHGKVNKVDDKIHSTNKEMMRLNHR
uniref:synaptosomal-associated protein 29-like n=1 Tax=Ciona intestinalis TaxID=7719 RepID=UPI00006A6CBD|nr:synaptosomal-associated protein 29-like [Ciona intestinalis]|eukprot:XP_002129612.1 synaptosomal-associated protein 29-like [Ciona intestinalis]